MKSVFEMMTENPEFRKELAVESLVLEATEVVSRLMHEQGVTKAELGRRMGKSRAWVTQLLNGSANMTLRTLAEVLVALDAEARVEAKMGAWQAKKKLPGMANKPVTFQVGRQVMESRDGGDVYTIVDLPPESQIEPAAETDLNDDQRPEYAA